MKTLTVHIKDAEGHFKELVKQAAAGAHIVLSDDERPLAQLSPVKERIPGLHAGAMTTSDDFDVPLPAEFWATGR